MTEPNDPPGRLSDMEAVIPAPHPGTVAPPEFVDVDVDHETSHYAFSMFYERTYPDLVRALSATLGDAGWGREAADEAMTRAFDRWGDVQGYANPAGWAYRVGLNWARSWHRKLARRLPWTDSGVALPQTHDLELDAALAHLDIKYRAVVVCRYLLDWSTAETASALDIAPGTVKSRLSVGLDKLRNILDEPPVIADHEGRQP